MRAFLPYWAPRGKGSNGSNSPVRQTVDECPVIAHGLNRSRGSGGKRVGMAR
jgi:hypothetical protein